MRRLGTRWLAGLLVACSPASVPPPPSSPPLAPSPIASAASTVPMTVPRAAESAKAGLEFVVGSLRGIELWNAKGELVRLVSPGAALHPRWHDEDSLLALAATDPNDLARGGTIEVVSIADGRRRKLAALPSFACAKPFQWNGEPIDWPLNVHDDRDFTLDVPQGLLCLSLMNRNSNMADLGVEVQVSLATGNLERWLWLGEKECRAPRGVQVGQPPKRCDEAPEALEAKASQDHAFDMTEAGLVRETTRAGTKTTLLVPGYAPEQSSPSGRWLVLGGDQSEGDYFHRSLLLLDRADGRVYPITDCKKSWPAALEPGGGSPPALKVPIAGAMDIVTETDVRWLGSPDTSEVLLVDACVVRPGASSFSVDGHVAH